MTSNARVDSRTLEEISAEVVELRHKAKAAQDEVAQRENALHQAKVARDTALVEYNDARQAFDEKMDL